VAPETLDDLLADVISKEALTEFALKAGIAPATLRSARRGIGRRGVTRGTRLAIAQTLRMSAERVDKAIEASRKARE
jgi:hypothetical protein